MEGGSGRREQESKVIAHADEFETSLYLHLAPERVQMDLAGADDDVMGAYLSSDSTTPYVRFNDYWSRWTDLGVHGDARPATAEKGRSSSRRRCPGWWSWPRNGAPGRSRSAATSTSGRRRRAFAGRRWRTGRAARPTHSGLTRDNHRASCVPPRSARSSSWLGS